MPRIKARDLAREQSIFGKLIAQICQHSRARALSLSRTYAIANNIRDKRPRQIAPMIGRHL